MKVHLPKSEDFSQLKISDGYINFKDIESKDLITQLKLSAIINIKEMFKDMAVTDIDQLYHDEDDFIGAVVEPTRYTEPFLAEYVDFITFDSINSEICVDFKDGFDPRHSKEKTLECLQEEFQGRVDLILGENNEKIIESKNEEDLGERLCDIENDLRPLLLSKVQRDFADTPGLSHLMFNYSKKPNSVNIYSDSHIDPTWFQSVTLAKRIGNTDVVKNKIRENLDKILPHPYIDEVVYDCDWKHRYLVHLTDEGLDYMKQSMKEVSENYYKENGLDPKTHLIMNNIIEIKTKKTRNKRPKP